MRFTNRRDFLKVANSVCLLQILAPVLSWGKDGSLSVNNSKISDKDFMKKFHEFYCQNYFNFDKHMTTLENEFIKNRLTLPDSWWVKMSDEVDLSTITYSQRIKGDKVNSSRIGCGSLTPNDASQKMARQICKVRGVSLATLHDQGAPMGLAWDFEEELFKVYFYESNLKKQPDVSLNALFNKVNQFSLYPFGIRSYSFKNNKIVEKKIYTPLKSMEKVDLLMKDKNLLPLKNKIQHINLMVTDQRDIVPQYDIKFGEDLEFSSFNSQGQKLIAEIDKKFALKMDTLSYTNKDEFALYYP